jgi:hypothetical protein
LTGLGCSMQLCGTGIALLQHTLGGDDVWVSALSVFVQPALWLTMHWACLTGAVHALRVLLGLCSSGAALDT